MNSTAAPQAGASPADSLQSTPAPLPSATVRKDVVLLVLGGLLLYGCNVDFWIYGDSGMYADYSMRRDFSEVTLHAGYYILVIFFETVGRALFGLPIQESMAWMNVVFGAATLGVAYVLALELLQSRATALLTVVIFAVSGRVIANSTTSEVYISQTFFVLLSFYLFTRARIVLSGIAAALAVLVSPLSAFAYLFFPVYDYQKHGRVRVKELSQLTLVALAAYAPYLILYGRDLLWGPRGLMSINTGVKSDPMIGLRNFPKYQFKQFTTMCLLCLPALIAFRKAPKFLWLCLAVGLPHLYIITKLTGEDNVFILNTDFFFAAALALGWMSLAQHRLLRWVGPSVFAAHAALYLVSGAVFAFEHHRDYETEMRDIARQYMDGQSASMITDWGTGIAFTFYGRQAPVSALMHDPFFARIYDLENVEQDSTVLNVQKLYVLDRWKPMPLNRLLSSKASIERQYAQNSIRLQAERRLKLRCRLLQEKTNKLYECSPALQVPPA